MDAELKSLLTVLIDKVERIDAKVTTIDAKVTTIDARVTNIEARVTNIEATMATKDDIARLEREQATTRQTFSANHFTLTGRVDQLTLQYETLAGVRASAAE